jgi:hypothetical protein
VAGGWRVDDSEARILLLRLWQKWRVAGGRMVIEWGVFFKKMGKTKSRNHEISKRRRENGLFLAK